jgi:glyoxylase-like metal-dependent hydrolase (beta-lactamase superfamily II)
MLFRQLIDGRSSTFTYLLADAATRDAVLIDPVFELFARDAALVRELDLALRFTLETHVHADHVTGAWLLREEQWRDDGFNAVTVTFEDEEVDPAKASAPTLRRE